MTILPSVWWDTWVLHKVDNRKFIGLMTDALLNSHKNIVIVSKAAWSECNIQGVQREACTTYMVSQKNILFCFGGSFEAPDWIYVVRSVQRFWKKFFMFLPHFPTGESSSLNIWQFWKIMVTSSLNSSFPLYLDIEIVLLCGLYHITGQVMKIIKIYIH